VHWREELPIEPWRIEVKVETLDDSFATIDLQAEYRNAVLRVDHERHDTRRKVEQSVRHEMMHLLTAEFQMFWDLIEEELPEASRKLAERAFDQAWELVVRRLERVWLDDES